MDDLGNDSGFQTVFRDLLAVVVFVLLLALAALILLINDPSQKKQLKDEVPGELRVEMYWPDDSISDVDLWVQAPGGSPIGFSSMVGPTWNLLRDDLGTPSSDASGRNYELAFSRGIPQGEYTINVHLWRKDASEHVPVNVIVYQVNRAKRNYENDETYGKHERKMLFTRDFETLCPK